MGILALGHTVAEVEDDLRQLATANVRRPVLNHVSQLRVDDLGADHLHTVTIGLASRGVAGGKLVGGHGERCHGRSVRTRSSV